MDHPRARRGRLQSLCGVLLFGFASRECLAMSGSKRALAGALLGCLLLGAVCALSHRGGDRETYPAAIGVRHSAGIEAPRAPQTMVAAYLDYSRAGELAASGEPFDPEGY